MKPTVRIAKLDNNVVLKGRVALLSVVLLSLIIVILISTRSGILS
ncbi:MAG: hypothetical protein OEQ74_06740 [Gammaproteobacteria bacterium]|nr:hypothetical protein [Gammaproteobacteria bacterium]